MHFVDSNGENSKQKEFTVFFDHIYKNLKVKKYISRRTKPVVANTFFLILETDHWKPMSNAKKWRFEVGIYGKN